MTPYVLDTDSLTLFQKGLPALVRQVTQHARQDVAITVISVEEQLSGWYTRVRRAKRRDESARAYDQLAANVESLTCFRILRFPEPAILRFEDLLSLKLGVGGMDLRIAAIVLEHGATLVTRNKQDFQRIPGLQFVDWSI